MKTAIIYSTMTGHSKKIALAMEKELNIPAHDIKSNPALITSSAGLMKQDALRSVLKEGGIAVREEEHTCKGSFLVVAMLRPNQSDLAEAVRFGRSCMEGNHEL